MDRADVTAGLVSRLVADQFPGWAGLPVRPVDGEGWDNRTFRLGARLAVRLPSAERYATQVEDERRWLPVLAARLPLPVPEMIARGVPGCGYPWPWSVRRWLPGRAATVEVVTDLDRFATDLAAFLVALHGVDPTGGPVPGRRNFFRGGPLATYDAETRAAIAALVAVEPTVDGHAALAVWDRALTTPWRGPPVWVHGDLTPSNLLVAGGRLAAVIDFGSMAVGDPACDLTIAWTFLAGSAREAFRAGAGLDDATWARARGWALWKALITWRRAVAEGRPVARAGTGFGWRLDPRAVVHALLADPGEG